MTQPKQVRNALSRLLAFDTSAESSWSADDLHAILRHQLDAEVEFDLTHFGGVAKETITAVAATGNLKGPYRFGQLLIDPDPPVEMLGLIRRFTKRHRTQGLEGMAEEVATALYYGAIAAARLRHGVSVSKLDDESLMDGLDWGLRQSWMTESLRTLFTETVKAIRLREQGNGDLSPFLDLSGPRF